MDVVLNVDVLVAVKVDRFVTKYSPVVNTTHIREREILVYLLFDK